MRVRLMRATSLTVVAALVGWTGAAAGLQLEAPGRQPRPPQTDRPSLPDGADEGAFDQRMGIPDLPPAVVVLSPDADVTNAVEPPAIRPARPVPVPATLPYDVSAEIGPATPTVVAAPPPAMKPVAEPSSALLVPATPAAVPPPPVPPSLPAIATASPPAAGAGLDAAGLTAALAAFLAEAVPGDTSAQASDRRAQREAIAAVYGAHGNAPLWVVDGHPSPAAHAVMARLDHAAEDGLDLARFPMPIPTAGSPAALARAELGLSEAVLAYARQARGSRINVARIGALIDMRPTLPDAAEVLGRLPASPDAGDALRDFNPPQPGYAALRDKLAELRQGAEGTAQAPIPYGPVLRPGMRDARVPLVRARFGLDVLADDPDAEPLVYDTEVAGAVADFQRAHRMPASGLLTARTIAALSGGNPEALEADILANMEFWRWMPRETAPDRIEVNIPAYTARVFRQGSVAHETRVVVGQPDKPTPVFAEQMRFIIVNPYWNVPLSIIKNEMMPKLASDPSYFADHGYEVVERDGTTYVRQPPGEGNALGRIKFMFPNSHAVYLHDTNARSYFGRTMRALSHGCVRVDQPFSFAEAVLGRENGWSEARVRKMIGGQERTINLPKPLPILITYFTATVDEGTGVQLSDDVYGYAGKVKAALGLLDGARLSQAKPATRASASPATVVQ